MNVVANNLCFTAQNNVQFQSASFEVTAGQCLIISGMSGSGKSLLLALICGLVDLESGSVRFNGLTKDQMTAEQESQFKKQLGVVFQKPALLSNLTLGENLMLPLIQHYPEMSSSERADRVNLSCRQFELDDYLDKRIEELPNGLQSLASLSRALICGPDLLIWDAPLADRDSIWSNRIIEILKQFKQDGKTIILFSNRKMIIEELADQNLHLVGGRLRTSGQT